MSKFAPHKRSTNQPRANSSTVCQKCLQRGHFIYECKYERPYVSRPSRTQQLDNPKLLAKLKADAKPSVEVPDEFKNKSGLANKILENKEKERLKEASSDSGSSESESDEESSSSRSSDGKTHSDQETDSDDSDSDSDSRSPPRRQRSRSHSRSRERKRKRTRSPSSDSEGPRRRR